MKREQRDILRDMHEISHLDHSVDAFLALHRTPFLTDFFLSVTRLGDARVITVVALSLLIVLWRHKRYAYKVGLLTALLGALGSSYIIKLAIERPRPPLALELIHESGYSFPSMHATVAMATYGFLIYLIGKLVHPPHHRMPTMVVLAILIALIGLSRLYLGVHYPSDVLAGYAIGALFVYVGVISTRSLLARRGRAK